MSEDPIEQNETKVTNTSPVTPRQLVQSTFEQLGFTNENPDDLDLVTKLLEYWRTNSIPATYSPEEYALLNDPDVQEVLSRCKEYYEPKTHLTHSDLMTILEDIALGKLKRTSYDFKSGEYVTEDPSFTDRIAAIRMLQPDSTQDDKDTVQFINNIGYGDILPPPSATPQSASDPKARYTPPEEEEATTDE